MFYQVSFSLLLAKSPLFRLFYSAFFSLSISFFPSPFLCVQVFIEPIARLSRLFGYHFAQLCNSVKRCDKDKKPDASNTYTDVLYPCAYYAITASALICFHTFHSMIHTPKKLRISF
jgi:hypothetical protein